MQILSKLETVSCRRKRLLVIAVAIAGRTKLFLISPIWIISGQTPSIKSLVKELLHAE